MKEDHLKKSSNYFNCLKNGFGNIDLGKLQRCFSLLFFDAFQNQSENYIPKKELQTKSAPQALVDLAFEHRGNLVILAIGPLTNLAIALQLNPEIVKLTKVCMMGGEQKKNLYITNHLFF